MSKYIFSFFATILLLFSSYQLNGQFKLPDWDVGVTSVAGFGDQAPFWLVSNRQGKYLPEKYAGSMELGIFAESDTGRIIDYDYGVELYGRQGGNGDLWLHQAYTGITFYDKLRFGIGMQEEIVGSKEPSLSTGSIIWSGNARPMPKIEISTPGYISVPFTNGYAEISGVMSHGWFEEGRYVSDVWLHHKNAYIRFGGSFPVNIYYGFNHYAQWGGSSPRQEEPFPSDLRAFLKVLFNKSGDPDVPGTPDGWVMNKFGNSLGSRNYGVDLNLDNFSLGIYQQDVFDDGSGMRKQNFPDGLWGGGLSLAEKGRIFQAVVYEFLQTTDQSGPVHILYGPGGNDNYFNHGWYRSGWTYHKYTIGTPFITSPILNELASYDNDYLHNTRVIAHHLGFEGYIKQNIYYRNFFTFSRNFGTFNDPFGERKDQFSWMFELTGHLNFFDLEASVTLAADFGEMYGDNYGMIFKLIKNGTFSR